MLRGMRNKPISIVSTLASGAVVITVSLMLTTFFSARAENAATPVIVELFTSQGCSSCPPADLVLQELTSHENVIALSLPIDYWDNLGWPDTFASPQHTERQRQYAAVLENARVYTPQMVINGHIDVVGSRRDDVFAAIEKESNRQRPTVEISLTTRDEALEIGLDDAPESLADVEASVWIAPFHTGPQQVAIKRGENGGRELSYSNVVQGLMKLGMYSGEKTAFTHSIAMLKHKNVDDCVILIQNDRSGEIIGVKKIDLAAFN